MEFNLKELVAELEVQYQAVKKVFIEYDGYEEVDYNLSMQNIKNDLRFFVDNYDYTSTYKNTENNEDSKFEQERFKDNLLQLMLKCYKFRFETKKMFGKTIFERICGALTELYFHITFPDKVSEDTEIEYLPFTWYIEEDIIELYHRRFDPSESVDFYDEDRDIDEDDVENLDDLLKSHGELSMIFDQL